jgi:hypothetical protein
MVLIELSINSVEFYGNFVGIFTTSIELYGSSVEYPKIFEIIVEVNVWLETSFPIRTGYFWNGQRRF